MQAIERSFNKEVISQLENLTLVAGYLRGKPFIIKTYEPGMIPEPVLTYVQQLQEIHGLSAEPSMSHAVVDLLNTLLVTKKYQDAVYIRVLHDQLRALGYAIPSEEYANKQYASGTVAAVRSFQKTAQLPVTDSMDLATEQSLATAYAEAAYTVKGSVHDANWNPVTNAIIEVFEKAFRGAGALLQSGVTDITGSYELSYNRPIDSATGRFVEEVHLLVRIKDGEGTLLLEEAVYHAPSVAWVKYTAGDRVYQGKSLYTEVSETLAVYLGKTPIHQIEESEKHQDVTYLYQKTGILPQTIVQLHLAERVAFEFDPSVPASVLFAFFKQQLPSILPSYLLPDTLSEWSKWSYDLLDALTVAVPLMPAELHERAFDRAVQGNWIPLADQQKKTTILQNLATLRLHYAKHEPLVAGRLSLRNLFQKTTLSAATQDTLALDFVKTQRLDGKTLEQWYQNGWINKKEHGQLEQELQLAALSLYDREVIQNLRNQYNKEGFSAFVYKVSDFAKWTPQDWENIDYDPDDPTGDFTQRAMALAPTVATIAALQRDRGHKLKHLENLATMVDDRQLLSLNNVPIDSYLKENSIELPKAAVEELKLLQRVEHLAPRPDLTPTLLRANIHSAYQVHRMGKAGLIQLYTQAGIATPLAESYGHLTVNTATQTLSDLTGLAASYGLLDGGGITPAAITPLPNLEDLFGNNDFCHCAHCRSVYSPAAYLTDLLHWLENKRNPNTNKTAQELLLERRPDLEHILLNCKNANTPMPYIDLVNEVLEYTIQPTPAYEKRNTTWDKAELRAKPEHRLDSVYATLALLPSDGNYKPYASYNGFNIWQSQVHLFLEKLGITSSQFVQVLKAPSMGYLEQVAATFELPSHEALAITTPHADVNQLVNPKRQVKALLHDHQLSYEQLLLLLESAYTNPGKILSITPANSCDLDELKIANMTAVELDRWWRFLRLWKYTNWTIWELDALIMHPKVANGTLNSFGLKRLADFKRLQMRLSKTVHEVLGMMGSLETFDRKNKDGALVPSFYETVFTHRLLDNSQQTFFNKNNPTLNLNLNNITPAQIAYIAAALGMTSSQIETLLAFPQQGQWGQVLPQRVHQMSSTLDGLALLYAYVNLAKQLQLSVEELKGYLRILMTTANPLDGLDQFNTFLDHYKALKASGMSLKELMFLLGGSTLEGYTISEDQIHKWQDKLFEQVGTAYDNAMISKQTEPAVLSDLLTQTGTFADQAAVDTFLEVLYQTPEAERRFTSGWDATARTNYLTNNLPTLFAYANGAALQQLTNDLSGTSSSVSAAIATLKVILHRRIHSNVVINYLAELWEVPMDVMVYLLNDDHPHLGKAVRHRLMEAPPTGTAATTHPIANIGVGPALPTPVTPISFTVIYRQLTKYVFLAKAWHLSGADLEQIELAGTTLAALNVYTLPLFNNNTAPALYVQLPQVSEYLNTAQWIRFAQTQNIAVKDLVEAILTFHNSGNSSNFFNRIAKLTGWELEALTAAHNQFQWTTVDYTTQLGTWQRWHETIALFHQLGITPNKALGWLVLYNTANANYFEQQRVISQQVQNVVREATDSEQQWLLVQQEVQDQLRLQKRNALVAYARNYDVQGNRVAYSTNDLYHKYLIDPQMSACQLTSRIKQAISSVQLYVQRCRLGLEQDTIKVIENQGWSEWEWMQNYRVWEANRKVFLYPENWIEPSLRDNKSELFKQFEEELLQQEISQENVALALQNYLVHLNDISNLEMMSLARGSKEGVNVTHVLARTKEYPAIYYYRSIDDASMQWTAWEKIPFDVQGEHPVLHVYNNKLHLFWLQILEQPEEIIVTHDVVGVGLPDNKGNYPKGGGTTDQKVTSNTVQNRRFHKEMKLAWAVLHQSGWSSQQLSRQKLIHPWPHPDYSIMLRPRPKVDLWLDVYISHSTEFNATYYYNQFINEYELLGAAYDPVAPATHYGSFVFDGFVRKIKAREIHATFWHTFINNSVPIYHTVTQWQSGQPVWFDAVKKTNTSPTRYSVVTNYGTFDLSNQDELNDLLGFLWGNAITQQEEQVFTNVRVYSNNNNNPILIIEYYIEDYRGNLNYHTVIGPLQSINNYLATDTMSLSNPRQRPAQDVQQIVGYTNTARSKEYIKHTNSSSIKYLHNTFSEEGQHITRLEPNLPTSPSDEIGADLNQLGDLRFKYNRLVTKTPGQALDLVAQGRLLAHPFDGTPDHFQVVLPMGYLAGDTRWGQHLTFQDHFRSFYLTNKSGGHVAYKLYHPHARRLMQSLGSQGLETFYTRPTQYPPATTLSSIYRPDLAYFDSNVEEVSFKYNDGYGLYNWEIFFHIPFLVATELSKNHRFEEAMAWFHCIFNPLGLDEPNGTPPVSDVSRYWITKPFYERTQGSYIAQQIQNLLSGLVPDQTQQAINEWKKHPFQPHVIARMRTVAYQKAVVMKYIDNLLAWGDQLFRRETLESINQAGLMYTLAAELLGDRPQKIQGKTPTDLDYKDIKADLDTYFSNTAIDDNLVISTGQGGLVMSGDDDPVQLYSLPNNIQYFCIPHNEKLVGYWDLVEDRLFKIRHCMNIDGRVRQLPLLAPPIDPALLVNAAANGVDLNDILQDLSTPKPYYKYRPLARLSMQFTAEVKALGQSLLSALQSRDAEGMMLLQSKNAINILDASIHLKQLQIQEAQENIQSLKESLETAQLRRDFYRNRAYMNAGENNALRLQKTATELTNMAEAIHVISSAVTAIPEIEVSVGLAAAVKTEVVDGMKIAAGFKIASSILSMSANVLNQEANMALTKASYDRRQEEWDFQVELATKDMEQVEQQIAAAKVRVAIAQKDLQVHQQQIDNAETELAYLQSKYTNQQLYSWMVGQLSTVYRQAYDLAFDLAKRAEKSLNYELGLPVETPRVIQHGYWNSLRKGLLAGDKLMLAINQLEDKYVRLNQRELELIKHISLHQWAPDALLQLKTTGKCELNIPEWWFDMDYPGHYLRRIKALTVSIPCIVGPNTNVNCKLTLSRHSLRRKVIIQGGAYDHSNNFDERFESHSIATSSGQNDGGVFELNFNDERFLPFEGLGAISTWTLELPEQAQFDYKTITDVVFHLRYTARDGGALLADGPNQDDGAKAYVQTQLVTASGQEPPAILMSAREAFPTAWHKFKNEGVPLRLNVKQNHYPFFTKMLGAPDVVGGAVGVVRKADSSSPINLAVTTPITIPTSNTTSNTTSAYTPVTIAANHYGTMDLGNLSSSVVAGISTWTIAVETPTQVEAIDDMYLLLIYKTIV